MNNNIFVIAFRKLNFACCSEETSLLADSMKVYISNKKATHFK